jgi:LAS superfamily LD-carboxypeptidase LdcB
VHQGISVVLIAASLIALSGPMAGAAGPSPGTPKPGTIEALRADVTRTADRLAAATLAWERGQQRLDVLIQRKIGTAQTADELQVAAQQARERVSTLAAAMYRNPVDPMLTAVLTGDPHSITDVLYLRRAAGQTSNERRADADLLVNQVQQTRTLLQAQDDATVEAVRLQEDAQASAVRLQAAVAELRRRQAAAAAAALGRAAAAALGQAAGAAGGASCSEPVPAQAINGFLPTSSLCPLATAPGQRLIAPAATAFDQLSKAFAESFGTPLCVTDSYRDYAGQVRVFATKPNLAATPGRSQHGWGRAVDLCGGVQSYGTPPYLWLKENAAAFGFNHPDWAEPDGSRPEPWHWEFHADGG